MEYRIVKYRKEHEESVARLNERLVRGGKAEYQFPEHYESKDMPREEGRKVWREYWVAVDSEGEVRGGHIFRGQPFWAFGKPLDLAFYKLPVSDGVVDPRHATVGLLVAAWNSKCPNQWRWLLCG